ncbi:MAG: helix-turn-helix transcriptional regulator [Magnetococcales bacterium]|nr:helix-turn-helix transcriptional regulator [Magnetococcales bacterium]
MQTIGGRLFRFRRAFNLKQSELASLVGASTSTISEVEADKRSPSYEIIAGIAENYPTLNAEWMLTGRGKMLNDVATLSLLTDQDKGDVVRIPYYSEVSVAAGAGAFPGDENNMSHVYMNVEVLRDVYGAQSPRLAIFPVIGPSMEPELRSGELVLVELFFPGQRITVDGVYVFRMDDIIMVKYLQRVPGGVEVVSMNKAFRPFPVDFSDESVNFTLIGRAIVGLKRL